MEFDEIPAVWPRDDLRRNPLDRHLDARHGELPRTSGHDVQKPDRAVFGTGAPVVQNNLIRDHLELVDDPQRHRYVKPRKLLAVGEHPNSRRVGTQRQRRLGPHMKRVRHAVRRGLQVQLEVRTVGADVPHGELCGRVSRLEGRRAFGGGVHGRVTQVYRSRRDANTLDHRPLDGETGLRLCATAREHVDMLLELASVARKRNFYFQWHGFSRRQRLLVERGGRTPASRQDAVDCDRSVRGISHMECVFQLDGLVLFPEIVFWRVADKRPGSPAFTGLWLLSRNLRGSVLSVFGGNAQEGAQRAQHQRLASCGEMVFHEVLR